jgi:hypothetical protein
VEAYRLCEVLRIPHCPDNRLLDGGKVDIPTHRPHFTPQKLFFKCFRYYHIEYMMAICLCFPALHFVTCHFITVRVCSVPTKPPSERITICPLNPKIMDCHLLAVNYCRFSMFADTLHICQHSDLTATRE